MSASLILIVSGLVCLGLSGFLMYSLRRQEGKAPPAFLKSEALSTSAAMGTFILLILGGTLMIKGIF